jgi:hypothetical protein
MFIEHHFRAAESNLLREEPQRLGGPLESDLVFRTALGRPGDQPTLPRGIRQTLGYTERVRRKTTSESSISNHVGRQ